MKIIRISNYNVETEPEYLVADNIKYENLGLVMLEALNKDPKRSDSDWFALVPDDRVLWRGMEDLV